MFSHDGQTLRARVSKTSVVLVRVPILSWRTCSYDLMCVHAKLLQSCLTLCNSMDCSPPGSSVHGILQARILEWVAMASSRGSSQPSNLFLLDLLHWQVGSLPLCHLGSPNQVSCIAGRFFIEWATREDSLWSQFSSVVQSCLDSLQPCGLHHARLPCPPPTPRVYPNWCSLSRWCHPTLSSSVVPFSSCLQSLPASGSFPMSQFFTSGGQRIGVSASASVLPMNIQDWFL